ncbi:MAG: hypothetical protein JWM27_1127 [Gemmatimonadetes bacterium]|nr:hypothetical protein [Gemmatimonadota bacterium]
MKVMSETLNEKQFDLLRYLYRQTGPVPSDHLDGRVVRALRSRKLIAEAKGWVSITDPGRGRFEEAVRRRRSGPQRGGEGAHRNARAEAIQRAIEALELALPKDAEVAVGPIFAYADDVVEGFRQYARRIEGARRPVRV